MASICVLCSVYPVCLNPVSQKVRNTISSEKLQNSFPIFNLTVRVKQVTKSGHLTELKILFGISFIFSYSYGGPGSQDVSSRWSLDWDHYLASARDFVVAHMDVRGSGFAGDDFKHAVFRRLGSVEVKDSLRVLKHLLKEFDFIDSSKVAVWGWSYGGYLAARWETELSMKFM